MFGYLKKIFAPEEPVVFTNQTTGVPHNFGESADGTATYRQMKNGKFRLLVNQNEVIGTYSRKRDLLRGAARKGLNVQD